jgi:hypothetical protein
MFILIYGADGSGKSVQAKNIAEAQENSQHWSFATKNRRLYAESGVISTELLRFNADSTINPYQTIDAFHDIVDKTVKENTAKLVVIDEITLLRKWAQPVVLEEINKVRRGKGQNPITKIGKDNAAAWARVNDLVYGRLEHLANWCEINDALVVAITAITEERRMVINSDGEASSETTGNWIADAKNNIRKLADVIVRLEKDGKNGRGYYAIIEKQQDWMAEGKDAVKVGKDGLLTEMMMRGVL